jgi:hypothetical protein
MSEQKINITAKEVNSKVDVKEKKSSVSIKDIAAKINKTKTYSTKVPNTKLNVIVTGLGEKSVPTDSLFRRSLDQFSYSDTSFNFVNKGIVDNKTIVDLFNRIVSYNRLFLENNTATEQSAKLFSKQLADSFTNNDIISNTSIKVLSSTFSHEDITAYSLTKIFAHSVTNSELATFLTNKGIEDNVTSLDLFNRVANYNLLLQSLADATDDFCQVCPDDDQTATFTKVIKEFQNTSEVFSRVLAKPFIELLTIEDTDPLFAIGVNRVDFKEVIDNGTTITTGKRLLSEYSFSDTSFRSSQKILNDNYLTNTIISFTPELIKVENLNSNSLISFNLNKLDNDQANQNDNVNTQWSAFYSQDENLVLQDLNTFETLVNKVENINSSESVESINIFTNYLDQLTNSIVLSFNIEQVLNNNAETQQIFVVNLNKSLLDNFTNVTQINFNIDKLLNTNSIANESINNTPNKLLLSDSLATEIFDYLVFTERKLQSQSQSTDSGLINNQNYFAEAYVEPGYVGTNRNI